MARATGREGRSSSAPRHPRRLGHLAKPARGHVARARQAREPARLWDSLERFAAHDARGSLHVCDFEGRVVAASVVLRHGPLATYAWGASVADKLPFSKAIPSLVASIRWARDVGCATFDLGGVPAEKDTDAKRKAIATFKHDFDKKRVRLVRRHARWLL